MKRILIILSFLSSVCYGQNVGTRMLSDSKSATEVTLSRLGILSDADISFGSSSFGTDQTAAIQAILDRATSTSPLTIFWDVKISTTGLKVKSNTTIRTSTGCGAILRDNSDNFLLSNYNWAPFNNDILDSNITIQGGIWNGNGWRGGVQKQIHSNSTLGMITGLSMFGVKNFIFRDAEIRNTRTFAIFVLTWQNVVFDNFIIDQGESPNINQDGMDVCGGGKNLSITNGKIRCGDDRISITANVPGGIAYSEDHTPYTGVNGNIIGVYINNIEGWGEGKFVRFCSSANYIENVYVGNLRGTARTWVVVQESENNFGDYIIPPGPGDFRNMTYENINVEIVEPYGYDYMPDVKGLFQIGGNSKNIVIRNFIRNNMTWNQPSIVVHNNHGIVTIDGLTIDGYYSNETGTTFDSDHISILEGTVTNLKIANVKITANGANGADFFTIKEGAHCSQPVFSTSSFQGIENIFEDEGGIINHVSGFQLSKLGDDSPGFLTSGVIQSINLADYYGTTPTGGTWSQTKGNAFTESPATIVGGGAGGELVFEAGFAGTASTPLSSYTPEIGTITTIVGSPTLDGAGNVTLPPSSYFRTTSFTPSGFAARLVPNIPNGAEVSFAAITAGSENAFIEVERSGSDYIIEIFRDNVSVGSETVAVSNFQEAAIVRVGNGFGWYYKDGAGTYQLISSFNCSAYTFTQISVYAYSTLSIANLEILNP